MKSKNFATEDNCGQERPKEPKESTNVNRGLHGYKYIPI